jgi:GntR family transcriptional regulator
MVRGQGKAEGGKAHRVYLLLRDEILRGMHAPGALLPGELRLAQLHGVSRVTIRRALDDLADEGLIERRPGAGTAVAAPATTPAAITADFASLMPQLVRMGETTTARLLSFAYVPAPPAVAAALGDGGRMQRAVRVRLAGGKPFSHLTTHVPEAIAQSYSEADLATTPLFRLLERSGVEVGQARQTISATLATPEVAEALDVAPGAALIALTRVVLDAGGRGVEHLDALYRPDRFRLEMTLDRVGEGGARHWVPAADAVRSAAE